MPRPRVDMRKIREVLRLALGEELSQRLVSAASGVPQTTVHEYLVRAAAAGLKWPLPGDLDDAGLEALLYPPTLPAGTARPTPDWQKVHADLRKKGVTLQLLWVEYRETHPGDGYGYSQFANLYRAWRNGIDVSMRQAHAAGEKLFVDFPGDTFPVYDPAAGQVALNAELFVAVLGASGYLYAEAFPSQELQYWVTAHVHCFEVLGGCPAIVVPDNLRSAVTTPDRYEPDVNATFAEMAAHYGVAIMPARAYKPRDKAKAESGVLLAERWIIARLRGRKLTSLGEANAAIAACTAGAMASELGRGGQSAVTGAAKDVIGRGSASLAAGVEPGRAGPGAGGRAEAGHRAGSRTGGGPGGTGRSGVARGPDEAAEVDDQVDAEPGRRADRARAPVRAAGRQAGQHPDLVAARRGQRRVRQDPAEVRVTPHDRHRLVSVGPDLGAPARHRGPGMLM